MSGPTTEQPFEYTGVNHIALVCKDMAETVDFYEGLLGMPLVKTIGFPGGRGQHFFFDCGKGATLAFMWFADGPPAAPGIARLGWLLLDRCCHGDAEGASAGPSVSAPRVRRADPRLRADRPTGGRHRAPNGRRRVLGERAGQRWARQHVQ